MAEKLCRGRHLAWRRLDDETVVVDSRGRRIYGLNEAGGLLWQRLEEPRTLAELAGAFAGADAAAVRAFVDELLAVGLLEEDDGTPPPLRLVGATEPEAAAAPAPADPVPALLWQDEIRRFAQSCAFTPPVPGPCSSFPFA